MHRLHETHWTEQLLTEAGFQVEPAATVEERVRLRTLEPRAFMRVTQRTELAPAEKKDLVAFLRALQRP